MTDEQGTELAVALIDAVNGVFGRHEGRRALHARGQGAAGHFTANGSAADLTTAGHLVQEAVPVMARLSLGGGNPADPDGAHAPRGLAVRFRSAAGEHDLVCANSPVFLTPTPELFLEFLQAARPDPATGVPDLDRLLGFLGEHPVIAANAGARAASPIPASYADVTFHGIHAFGLRGPDGELRWAKFRWDPVPPGGTNEPLSDEAGAAQPVDYLTTELRERLQSGVVEWDLVVRLGEPGDGLTDPSVDWPADRPERVIGRLTLDEVADAEALIFDPNRVIDGIELGDDPVLAARGTAYSESYRRRAG